MMKKTVPVIAMDTKFFPDISQSNGFFKVAPAVSKTYKG